MSGINLMYVFDPYYGEDTIRALLESGTVDSCFHITRGKTDIWGEGRYHSFSREKASRCQYATECDLNSLPALSKELLEKMRPYESMAIKMIRRETSFPIVEYETGKMKYHTHLRFWSYIFDRFNINCVFFDLFPHRIYDYFIYCLAKIKNIPILCHALTNIPGLFLWCDSIETVGDNIRVYYQSIASSLDLRECVLEGPVADFYEHLNRDTAELNKKRDEQKFAQNELRSLTQIFFGRYLGLRGFMLPQRLKIRFAMAAVLKYHDWNHYREHKEDLEYIYRTSYDIRYYLRHRAIRQKAYNRMAEYPDYEKKYIYFALQFTPEVTTIPCAGVFAEQYTSVQLIARAAEKCGVLVYVKEHVVQPFRDKAVYQALREIPNVRLIKTSVSTYDLMERSIAVASQTGTILLEAAIHRKPGLVLSDGCCWKGLPSLFEIEDEETGATVIKQVLDGFSVSSEEIKRYFYAIQKCCTKMYWPEVSRELYSDERDGLPYRESLDIQIKLLKKWLQETFESTTKPDSRSLQE